MGRYAKESGDFQPAPVGTHLGRCFSIVDIGTQIMKDFDGNPTHKNQIIVGFELPNELMKNGKPFIASRFYTNSLHPQASLRQDLEQWRGRAFSEEELIKFDLVNLLGKPCMISIVAKEGGRGTKVSSITAIPKGTAAPDQINKSFFFFLDDFDATKFEMLSDGLKKMVQRSEEYITIINPGINPEESTTEHETPADEVPF